jgi:tetratricopeptide (TPR) repeat protein
MQLGRLADAFTMLDIGLQRAREVGHRQWEGWAHLYRAWIYLELLAHEPAQPLIALALEAARNLDSGVLLLDAVAAQIQSALLQQDVREAQRLFAEHAGSESFGHLGNADDVRLELNLLSGDLSGALGLLDQFAAETTGEYFTFGDVRRQRLIAETLARAGQFEDAEVALARALSVVDQREQELERWKVWRQYERHYRLAGQPARAEEARRQLLVAIHALAETVPDLPLREQFVARASALQ